MGGNFMSFKSKVMVSVLILLTTVIPIGATSNETSNNLVFHTPEKYMMVSGVIRNTGDGWELITDDFHDSINVESVSNGKLAITVNHSFTAKKVVSFVVTPDETFVKEGLTAGASVGLDKTNIYLTKLGSNSYSDPNKIINSKGNFWFQGMFIVK
jgi:hypothetical protein